MKRINKIMSVALSMTIAGCSALGTVVSEAKYKAPAIVDVDAGNGSVEINETNFPDKYFREKVQYYSQYYKLYTVETMPSISVNSCDMKSAKGIEYLKGLEQLYIDNTKLDSLDISNNTKLKTISLSNNNLKSLDVSQNAELSILSFANWNEYAVWSNLNENGEITEESEIIGYKEYENFNKISSVDLSNCSKLKELVCFNNELGDLDVSKNKELLVLNCSNNKLVSLDLSNNTKLTDLTCFGNKIKSLDLSKNTDLINLSCGNLGLDNLTLVQNTKLESLFCINSSFKALDLSNNTKLKSLELSASKDLETLTIPNSVTTFTGNGFKALKVINYNGTIEEWEKIDKKELTLPNKTVIHCTNGDIENTTKEVTKIELASTPTKTTYETGDALDTTGGNLKVTYDDKTTETIAITAAMCTGFDSTKAGKQTITVTYEGKTAKFTVTVKEKEKPSTDLFEIGSADYPTIASAIAQINKDIKAKSAKPAYTMILSGDLTEKKAISFPDVPVVIKSDAPVSITVPSITAKGDLTLENITLKTAKGTAAAVTAKKSLTVTGCTLGAVKASAALTVTDSTFDALTASGKTGTATTLGGTIVIAKALTVSNDLVVSDGADITVNGKFTPKGTISFGAIKAFTVKNGK